MSYGTATLSASPGRAITGQTIRLTITIHDDTATLADPSACTLTLLQPDNTTSSTLIGALVHDSVGLYHYDYAGTIPGTIQATVTTSTPNATAETSFILDPNATGRLNSGYITVAEFKAMPTRLAVDQQVINAAARMQDAELAAILTRSSQWADTFCQAPLGAHTTTLLRQVTTDADGDAHVAAGVSPKMPILVTSVAWGRLRTALTALTDLTNTFADRGLVTVGIGGYTGSWVGALQFGSPAPSSKVWISLGLIPGWPNTVLAADQNAGDITLTVLDPTGIVAGTVLQLTNPGVEETVTVQSVATDTVTLTAGLLNAQTVGCGITAIPSDVREAVAYAACARITTPGTESNPTPGASLKGPKASTAATGGYQGQAEQILKPYQRRLP